MVSRFTPIFCSWSLRSATCFCALSRSACVLACSPSVAFCFCASCWYLASCACHSSSLYPQPAISAAQAPTESNFRIDIDFLASCCRLFFVGGRARRAHLRLATRHAGLAKQHAALLLVRDD